MSIKSVLRFDNEGIAYVAICSRGSFGLNTAFSFQAVGSYDPKEVSRILEIIISMRNTNPHDDPSQEKNYYSEVSFNVGKLEFNYRGNGNLSIIVNKSRVLYSGEANMLKDFANKCSRVKF